MPKQDYITQQGWQTLRQELDHLWRTRRPHVVQALADAAAEGDRSENAEYIYRKKELREIDRRLRYLGKRLDELTVVPPRGDHPEQIFFGAWVDVADDDDSRHRYRIVGADETDGATGAISLHSPVARALLGKRCGDVVEIKLPNSSRELEIEAIHYADPNQSKTSG